MCLDIVDDGVVDYVDRVRDRIRERDLHGSCEYGNHYPLGHDQHPGDADQRVAERDDGAYSAATPQGDQIGFYLVLGVLRGSTGFDTAVELTGT